MNFRDVELLSSYLDGQLTPAESTRLESRLSSDRELSSVLRDLREARGLLRQLPARKAPRNFTLTRKMVGAKPPKPRFYPLLKYATIAVAIIFFTTFALSVWRPSLRAAPTSSYGIGGGGCDSCEATFEAAMATEAPAMEAPTEAPIEPAVATEPPAVEEIIVTATAQPSADTMNAKTAASEAPTEAPVTEAPVSAEPPAVAKIAVTETPQPLADAATALPIAEGLMPKIAATPTPTKTPPPPPVPPIWQVAVGVALMLLVAVAFALRLAAKRKWK
jgi:hypothetical protein